MEGGPRAIVECAITKTPIISTNVGISSEILDKKSIYSNPEEAINCETNINVAYNKIINLMIPDGFNNFNKMFSNLISNI